MLRRRDPSSVFRSVLLLSAVGTACGGAIETVGGDSAESTPTREQETTGGGSTSSGGGSTSSSGGTSTSSGGGSTSSSGGTSTSSSGGSTSSSGGNWTCQTGDTPMNDAYCCPPGQTCPGGWAGGDSPDGGTCVVDCQKVCDAVAPGVQGGFDGCYLQPDGKISYYCGACGVGRLPNDTKPCPMGESIGERLARQAYYEGVSVVAFERLANVLLASGAPDDLVARARRAADDEARHAAIFADLARAHGTPVPAIELAAAEQSLFDLAIENATEGCVRETLGAAITLHQAMHAESGDVRAAFAAICDDEAEHASFSWDLWAWFDRRLTTDERARVARAHHEALAAARIAAMEAPDAAGVALGLPTPARARRMLDLSVEAMAA